MKRTARFLVRLITVAIPVFIAACYGPAYRFLKRGRVLDKASHEGISDVQVTCLRGTLEEGRDWSMSPDGAFTIGYDQPCTSLNAHDTLKDYPADAGVGSRTARYADTTVPFNESAEEVVVEMQKE
jgi:hypothetical protein